MALVRLFLIFFEASRFLFYASVVWLVQLLGSLPILVVSNYIRRYYAASVVARQTSSFSTNSSAKEVKKRALSVLSINLISHHRNNQQPQNLRVNVRVVG